jgi:hypothetical protein
VAAAAVTLAGAGRVGFVSRDVHDETTAQASIGIPVQIVPQLGLSLAFDRGRAV